MLNSQGAAPPESWGGSATFSSRRVRRSPHCARRLPLKSITGTRLCGAAGSAAGPAHPRQICAVPPATAALEASQLSQPRHASAQAPSSYSHHGQPQSHRLLTTTSQLPAADQLLSHGRLTASVTEASHYLASRGRIGDTVHLKCTDNLGITF